MRYALALIAACCALAGTQLALASDGGQSTPSVSSSPCTPIKTAYAERNWRERRPARGLELCPVENAAGARNTVEHWRLYRHYRQITPYRCLPGREGTFAIPCYIIACESHFNWWAMNSSGASYIYQLMQEWSPPPPNTFRNRVRNHEIAAGLSLSNWACA